LDQGSRLSAVRLAQFHAARYVRGIWRGFDQNDLYDKLSWLCQNQDRIERRSLVARNAHHRPELFLYDVASSHLEGDDNAAGAYGYNRDGKKGKIQIVIGLVRDKEGTPVSTEVFRGNTHDPRTFVAQIHKASQRFAARE
jgi:transposase